MHPETQHNHMQIKTSRRQSTAANRKPVVIGTYGGNLAGYGTLDIEIMSNGTGRCRVDASEPWRQLTREELSATLLLFNCEPAHWAAAPREIVKLGLPIIHPELAGVIA